MKFGLKRALGSERVEVFPNFDDEVTRSCYKSEQYWNP